MEKDKAPEVNQRTVTLLYVAALINWIVVGLDVTWLERTAGEIVPLLFAASMITVLYYLVAQYVKIEQMYEDDDDEADG